MTYEQAIEESDRVGASKVEGLPHLAITLAVLSRAHAINPKLAYDGAVKKGLTSREVLRLSPVSLGNLMFL